MYLGVRKFLSSLLSRVSLENNTMNWYLIQTKSNAHQLASEHLYRQNFKVFLPLIRKTSKTSKKFVTRVKPLFPGYLFIGSKSNSINWNRINATRGVSRAVTLDGIYRPINNEIITALQNRCDKNDQLITGSDINSGDSATIEKGPLTGFVCKVEQIDSNKRVWVLLELLDKTTRAKVPMNVLFK